MTRPVVIVGGGGHARVLIAALQAAQRPIAGVVDLNPSRELADRLPVPLLGDESALANHPPQDFDLVLGIGGVSSNEARQKAFHRLKGLGYHLASVVDPSATLRGAITLGEGVQILAGALLQPGVRLGDNVLINTGAQLDHDCQVASHVHVAPGAALSGDVTVAEAAHVGLGARVIQGVTIGAGSIVGAGAVVIHDVPSARTVAGVPARDLRLS